jgi:hypothetical protein
VERAVCGAARLSERSRSAVFTQTRDDGGAKSLSLILGSFLVDCVMRIAHYFAGAVGQDGILRPVGNRPFSRPTRLATVDNRRAPCQAAPLLLLKNCDAVN